MSERNDTAVLNEARQRFTHTVDLLNDQMKRELDDLKFEFDPWPEEVKKQRGGVTINGVPVPPRPMLTIPTLDQPVQLLINQQKASHLGVQIHPVSEDASDATAEVIQDLYRDIETKSRASLARDWAFERAVKCGRGAYRIDKVWADEDTDGPGLADQKIVITRILNQGAVYFDPMAQQPDFSDMQYCFVGGFMPFSQFKREFPDSKVASYDDQEFSSLGDSFQRWIASDDENERSVRVMEYWRVVQQSRTKCLYRTPDGREVTGWKDELGDDVDIVFEREVAERTVEWFKLNGMEILDRQDWDGQYIPIVPVIGREANIDGLRRWTGVISPAKDAARLFNYGVSSAVETAALAPRQPWLIAEGQEEGHEQEFLQSSTRNFPYLRYKPTTLNGQPVAPPQRIAASADISSAIAIIHEARDYVHSATFAFEPTLGQVSSQRSGKAVLALQQQSDVGNSNYLDNLTQISMTYEAKVILDLIPRVYDRPGRVVQIRGKDDVTAQVMLNQPYVEHPATGRPMPVPPQMPVSNLPPQGMPGPMLPGAPPMPGGPMPAPAPKPVMKHYDLNKGRYAVTVTVGKSYQTRLQAGSDQLGQLMQSDPALVPILSYYWAKFQDWPGHEEVAEDLKKMRPPQLQGGDDQSPQALQQQLAQQAQMLSAVGSQLQDAMQKLQTDAIKQQAMLEKARLDNETRLQEAKLAAEKDIEVQRLRNEAQLAAVELQATLKLKQVEAQLTAEAQTLVQQSHEAAMDRQHDLNAHHLDAMHESDTQMREHAHQRTMPTPAREDRDAGNE